MKILCTAIVVAPLVGGLLAGVFSRHPSATVARNVAHTATLLGVGISLALSCWALLELTINGAPVYRGTLYTWAAVGDLQLEIGFLLDTLSATLMIVVNYVSLLVHIYSIGYMRDDPGYARFFCYISLFTFAMLTLVIANNFLQLFFGWEAVGLVSYLLIGFWFKRDSAIAANLKAFLINRVGDFGFLLGIAAIAYYAGSLDYQTVFQQAPTIAQQTLNIGGTSVSVITATCLLLFIGAMGKSAQMPLHVWLPDSMEGPTPISALIHAATMVTAGIFMVARLSPLFEYSTTALTVILLIGALTALLMGLVGIVQHDIKRVVAYSTLSQLGYMTVALGVSAYSAAIFHLVTHAFFKALLFLAAGSVIIALHHEQDMRKMGGLRQKMPLTFWTCLIGCLALIGFPGFAGFYSKDIIIEAVHHSELPGAGFAYACVLLGVVITAFYTFRMLFITFLGAPRYSQNIVHESPKVVTLPLLLLAIPSILAGAVLIEPLLFGDYFAAAIQVMPQHDSVSAIADNFHGALSFIAHGFTGLPIYLALFGVAAAWVCYIRYPQLPAQLKTRFALAYSILQAKYGFDQLYQNLARGGLLLARQAWQKVDAGVIDGWLVNGSARLVALSARWARQLQTGFLYHYAVAMALGLLLLLIWVMWP